MVWTEPGPLHFGVPGHGEAVETVGDDSHAGEDQKYRSVGFSAECFQCPVESGGFVGLRKACCDDDQQPGAGDDEAFCDVAEDAESSHQVAGGAFEIVEKVAAGALVDVVSANGDDDDAADDEYGSAAGGLYEPRTERGILVSGGIPGTAGESKSGVGESQIDDGQRKGLRPIQDFRRGALAFRVGGTAER